ncbi:MAG: MBOAT family protein [Gemmataceae bacterium]|nr:MBOAT family protein [Gemmataceae bacterium]
MNFASPAFFVFLPIVLAGYHLLRERSHKYCFLLAASWLFYMWLVPWFLGIILFTTAVDFASGLLIERAETPRRRRAWLTLSIVTNLGFLAFFKYANFVLATSLGLTGALGAHPPNWVIDVVLPLGISFHTFQGISYTLDVYRGKTPAVRGFVDFALFVAFFPQLVAGPIVRAVEFLPQMETPPRVTATQIVEGLHWFVLGLGKKVFLADRLGTDFVDPIFADPGAYDAATLRWGVLAYAAQIYCDFSGYSDLAIGCAKWFGFELPRNFNFPYLASNIADFWKRWHMSLSTWMRDYLYIALGGSRQGLLRTHFNLLATLTLCGLWHGADWKWVLWGFYNGVLLVLHRIYDQALAGRGWADRLRGTRPFRALAVPVTFLLVALGLVLVRAESWPACWLIERVMLGGSAVGRTHWLPIWVPVLVGLVAIGHLFSGLRALRCGILQLPPLLRAGAYVTTVVFVVVFGMGAGKAFIYFQF